MWGSGTASFPERNRTWNGPHFLMKQRWIVQGFAHSADQGPVLSDVSGSSSVSIFSATGLRPEGPVTPACRSHRPLPCGCQMLRDLETLASSWAMVGQWPQLGSKEPSDPSAYKGWVGRLVPCPH